MAQETPPDNSGDAPWRRKSDSPIFFLAEACGGVETHVSRTRRSARGALPARPAHPVRADAEDRHDAREHQADERGRRRVRLDLGDARAVELVDLGHGLLEGGEGERGPGAEEPGGEGDARGVELAAGDPSGDAGDAEDAAGEGEAGGGG